MNETRTMSYGPELAHKIINKSALVAVVGLGYVGLPLAVQIASKEFPVIGIDISEERIQDLMAGRSYVEDVTQVELDQALSNRLQVTSDFSVVRNAHVIIISVPTPLDVHGQPDLTYIHSATKSIANYVQSGTLVVLESTTYPGTTKEMIKPILESVGLQCGGDVFVAYSPERVDPGNSHYKTKNTPKIVGGVTEQCSAIAGEFYRLVLEGDVKIVSNSTVAELEKIFENTFRNVNIALVNELAIICDKMGVDVWEVIDAASTKPYGFMPFYPGPGVGGHCIPIDPVYLTWKMKEFNYSSRLINLASEINNEMPGYIVARITELLNTKGKSVNGSSILLLGVAYKKNVSDVRESPVLHILDSLKNLGANVTYSDPKVPFFQHKDTKFVSRHIDMEVLSRADLVVITTDHTDFNYEFIQEYSTCILDTRNALKYLVPAGNVHRL